MGFWSSRSKREKGQSPPPCSSYVRSWADAKMEELKYTEEVSPENLFTGMMYILATFGKPDPRRKTSPELLDVAEHFSGDASLFELGCYIYFRVDMWFFANKPHLRERISRTFVREFVRLFSRALGVENLQPIFTERVSKYRELARKGEDIERYHFYLSQLISRTKDNPLPEHYDWDHAPLNLKFFEDAGIKLELLTWEQAMMPALIESLKECCSLMG